ncbi:MAG: hypothetical protein CMN85_03045 [Spongiibacteraceae bacterium]|nr:hypothetical protein [Spongiibacteraceae bacterium]|tara:strand:- start:149 stop:436 length:288 start_codon:yes stop_codon:yes gene_type:complete
MPLREFEETITSTGIIRRLFNGKERDISSPPDKSAAREKLRGSVLKYNRPLEPAAEDGEWGSFFMLQKGLTKTFLEVSKVRPRKDMSIGTRFSVI